MKIPVVVAILLSLGIIPNFPRGQNQDQAAKPKAEAVPATEEEKKVADSVNRFGFKMLSELTKEPGKNVFFSPASISTALAMTWNGTGGETAAEMARALELPALEKDSVNGGFRALLAGIQQGEPKVEVNAANALWLHKGGAFHPDFLRVVQEQFFASSSRNGGAGRPARRMSAAPFPSDP